MAEVLPNLLLIGAMKAGTTTFSADLARWSGIFLPATKEPHFLSEPDFTPGAAGRAYARLYGSHEARAARYRLDASTGYAKMPLVKTVPERAFDLLGGDLRIIYLVRDPVERALSHHAHLLRNGRAPVSFAEALASVREITAYSRYGYQIGFWLEKFPEYSILPVCWESYLAHRDATLNAVAEFLRMPRASIAPDSPVALNRRDDIVNYPHWIRALLKLRHGATYKAIIAPALPRTFRVGFQRLFGRAGRGPEPIVDPGATTILRDHLGDDLARLSARFPDFRASWLPTADSGAVSVQKVSRLSPNDPPC